MKKKICFRCHKLIEEDSNYYSFIEMNKKKIVSIDYAHRTCWDDFLKQVGNADEAMGMLRGMRGKLQELGILAPEQVVIK